MEIVYIVAFCVACYAIGAVHTYFNDTLKNYTTRKGELNELATYVDTGMQRVEEESNKVKTMAQQYSEGFPLLADAYSEYFALYDGRYAKYLEDKTRPAQKTADLVRQLSEQKREAIKEAKQHKYLTKYYEEIAPFLLDAKVDLLADLESRQATRQYDESETQDVVTQFLTKDEYRKLSVTERNQLALDRYWDRKKSKGAIGFLYERYVGYLFQIKGYEVDYHGIVRGFEDLGRDLIATKGDDIVVIQCKNWSRFKEIHENHIFQFFGTVYRYKFDHPTKQVKAAFYTSTKLSDISRKFAHDLGIELHEEFRLERYPSIKCNISQKSGEKIYHLPMDQQYDAVKLHLGRGEVFVSTVKEAEDAGFRRAYRWQSKAE